MSVVGTMDSAYFTSRTELVAWLNAILPDCTITKVEQCSSCTPYLRLLPALFPGSCNSVLQKAKFPAKMEYESLHNFKLLQNAFTKQGVEKSIDMERICRGNYQANLEFLQWFKRYCDTRGVLPGCTTASPQPTPTKSGSGAFATQSGSMSAAGSSRVAASTGAAAVSARRGAATVNSNNSENATSSQQSSARGAAAGGGGGATGRAPGTGYVSPYRRVAANSASAAGSASSPPATPPGGKQRVMATTTGAAGRSVSPYAQRPLSAHRAVSAQRSPSSQRMRAGSGLTNTTASAAGRVGSTTAGAGVGAPSTPKQRQAELEKAFYYDKLRNIELLVTDEEGVGAMSSAELAGKIQELLFSERN